MSSRTTYQDDHDRFGVLALRQRLADVVRDVWVVIVTSRSLSDTRMGPDVPGTLGVVQLPSVNKYEPIEICKLWASG